MDAGVAEMLRRAGFLDEAHAAMHLDADRGDGAAGVGTPGLGHRGQEIDDTLFALARVRVGMTPGFIE